ncbi:cobalt-precorrin-6A reductase [Pseudonocardia ailaonensis]|uniref:Cobalt-precorrin-6A reductase n=1 Tax=Pseudonocardia ailaonensis TaxID=367279 RepID=A0ABN2N7R6_9PSEU
MPHHPVTGSDLRILVLGGTSDARALAGLLDGRASVVSSLAGRVKAPVLPPGEVRIGGFGGVPGLVAYLRSGVDVLVDATHPFAAGMSAHACAAATETGVPLVVLRRPGWTEGPGDDWRRVPSLRAAAGLLPSVGRRVFLTTGRQDVATFADLDLWFLLRSVDPPEPPVPQRLVSILDRGPFTVEGELAVMREHAVDVVVTKDSGGSLTAAKLTAARQRGLPVIVVDRPPLPPGALVVETPGECVAVLEHRYALTEPH